MDTLTIRGERDLVYHAVLRLLVSWVWDHGPPDHLALTAVDGANRVVVTAPKSVIYYVAHHLTDPRYDWGTGRRVHVEVLRG